MDKIIMHTEKEVKKLLVLMIENEFIVKPDQVDYTIGNIVAAIEKGYELQKLENEKLDIERMD